MTEKVPRRMIMDYEKKLKELADSYGEWWNKGFPFPK